MLDAHFTDLEIKGHFGAYSPTTTSYDESQNPIILTTNRENLMR
jgi:hypothetical protein